MASLRNVDFNDRELLHIINDIAGADAVTSLDVATALGMSANGHKSLGQRVSTRLSWMVRLGFLARIDPLEQDDGKRGDPVRWMITDVGRQIMAGKLSKSLEERLDAAKPGDQVLLMRRLTQRGYVNASQEVANAVRREYLHNIAQRQR